MGGAGPSGGRPLSLQERLEARALANVVGATDDTPEPGPDTDRHPQSVGEAVDNLLAAFPGSVVVEDWRQVGPTTWADGLTGYTQDTAPPRAVAMTGG